MGRARGHGHAAASAGFDAVLGARRGADPEALRARDEQACDRLVAKDRIEALSRLQFKRAQGAEREELAAALARAMVGELVSEHGEAYARTFAQVGFGDGSLNAEVSPGVSMSTLHEQAVSSFAQRLDEDPPDTADLGLVAEYTYRDTLLWHAARQAQADSDAHLRRLLGDEEYASLARRCGEPPRGGIASRFRQPPALGTVMTAQAWHNVFYSPFRDLSVTQDRLLGQLRHVVERAARLQRWRAK